MHVGQSRQYAHAARVDRRGAGRHGDLGAGADGNDPLAGDQDHAVGDRASLVSINDLAADQCERDFPRLLGSDERAGRQQAGKRDSEESPHGHLPCLHIS